MSKGLKMLHVHTAQSTLQSLLYNSPARSLAADWQHHAAGIRQAACGFDGSNNTTRGGEVGFFKDEQVALNSQWCTPTTLGSRRISDLGSPPFLAIVTGECVPRPRAAELSFPHCTSSLARLCSRRAGESLLMWMKSAVCFSRK